MATIRPFKALRPQPDKAVQVSSVPYDVVHEDEVRQFLEGNPLSFLRVTRAEAEFAETPEREKVFGRARENLERLIADDVYLAESQRCYYVYELRTDSHTQTGIVGVCSLDDYDQGLIKPHEHVRPEKVDDRTEHLLAVGAQTGLILLTFRNTGDIEELLEDAKEPRPLYDFVCADSIRQRVWRVEETASWTEAFRDVPHLYIADGHHRIESASQARGRLRAENPGHDGTENYNFVLAGMFPAADLKILSYNRVVKDLNRLAKEDFFDKIRDNFVLAEDTLDEEPTSPGRFSMYFRGGWYKLKFNPRTKVRPSLIESLDVSILQDYLLGPVLGITDPRTDERIGFVGGKRGTDELERMVDEGEAAVAFSLYPTTVEDMLDVSDEGETMPPKSTWFEPKLRDGLLVFKI